MGLVKTRRLAAMLKQRAKVEMTPLASKQARKHAPFPLQSSKRPTTKSLPPNR